MTTIISYLFNVILGRSILLTYKHKTHAVDSNGKIVSNADVDFYIDDVSLFAFPPGQVFAEFDAIRSIFCQLLLKE